MPPIPGRLAWLSVIDNNGVEHRLDSPVALGHPQCRHDPGPAIVDSDLVFEAVIDDVFSNPDACAVVGSIVVNFRPGRFWPDEMQARRRVRRRQRKADVVRWRS